MVNTEKTVDTSTTKKSESDIKFKTEVFYTYSYHRFKYIEGNRMLDLLNLEQVKESAKEEWLINPILINEHWEIIEGQHRFEAAKELKLPVFFIKCPGYGLKQTYRLNTIGKKWDAHNFAESYAKMGNENYQMWVDFRKKYGFDTRSCLACLSVNSKRKFTIHDFNKGLFVVEDPETAHALADRIVQIGQYHKEHYKKRAFAVGALRLMSHKLYNHQQMLEQLEKRPYPIYHFPNSSMYLDVLSKIYNYEKKTGKIKI